MKKCTKCGVNQPLTNYLKNQKGRDGLRPHCKTCFNTSNRASYKRTVKKDPDFNRNRELIKKYGITLADREVMLKEQGGRCKICQRLEKDVRHSLLCVDHCHTSGEVRGLLCAGCNTALGSLEDNPTAIKAALAYITHNGDI